MTAVSWDVDGIAVGDSQGTVYTISSDYGAPLTFASQDSAGGIDSGTDSDPNSGSTSITSCPSTTTTGGAPGQSCSDAPSSSDGTSYFVFSGDFTDSDGSVTSSFSLLLGAQFQSGTTSTSADAQYLLISVSGNVQRSDMTDPISISMVDAPGSYDNDDLLSPYGSPQLDSQGIAVTDSNGKIYRIFSAHVTHSAAVDLRFSALDTFGANEFAVDSDPNSASSSITSCPSTSTSTGAATASCSDAPSSSDGTSYFTYSRVFTDASSVTFNLSLLLGGQLKSGTSATSADAQYLLTSVSGSVQRSDMSAPLSISTVAAPYSQGGLRG